MKYIYVFLLTFSLLACKEKTISTPPVDTTEKPKPVTTNDLTKENVDRANEIGKLNSEIDKLNNEIRKEIQALKDEK